MPQPCDAPFANAAVADLSSDQSELLITQPSNTEGPYFSLPMPAGSPRPLGDITGRDAAWEPNGKLVFTKGSDIYLADHDGANPRKVLTASGIVADPMFSPDGARFRFMVVDQNTNVSALWEANADSSDMQPLLPGWNTPPSECCGRWTPDGKYYIFGSTREGATNIWIISEGSSFLRKVSRDPVQLTTGPLQFTFAIPSKDGRKLFSARFSTARRAGALRFQVREISFLFWAAFPAATSTSRATGNGSRMSRTRTTRCGAANSTAARGCDLPYPPMRAALNHWSPDGNQIAFSASTPGKPWKVYLLSKDGGKPAPLSFGGNSGDRSDLVARRQDSRLRAH